MTIKEMYIKYNNRYEECQSNWDKAYAELANNQCTASRKQWLTDEIQSLNAQISAYECIVKDLKEILNETSR